MNAFRDEDLADRGDDVLRSLQGGRNQGNRGASSARPRIVAGPAMVMMGAVRAAPAFQVEAGGTWMIVMLQVLEGMESLPEPRGDERREDRAKTPTTFEHRYLPKTPSSE